MATKRGTKRKDKSRVVLKKGESQRKDGTYDYRWTSRNGRRHSIYAQTLEELRIKEDDSPRITFKPSVDITFGTAAKVFSDKVLAIVLTGMGSDGRDGCRLLKQFGSRIWAQDEASCVVYGMPQAVTSAGLTDVEVSLPEVAGKIMAEVGHG